MVLMSPSLRGRILTNVKTQYKRGELEGGVGGCKGYGWGLEVIEGLDDIPFQEFWYQYFKAKKKIM